MEIKIDAEMVGDVNHHQFEKFVEALQRISERDGIEVDIVQGYSFDEWDTVNPWSEDQWFEALSQI